MIRLTPTLLTLSAIFFADSYGTTWFIKPDGTGDAPTIQAGIDSAVAGDTVSLKNGTYTGNGNRDIDFLGKAIVVRSELGEPSWCIIDCEGNETEYHRGFHLHSGEDSTSVLEGVTVTGGELGYGDRGAGILCENASAPTLKNCDINMNTIYNAGKGGGLYCSGVSMNIENCVFRRNRTQKYQSGMLGVHHGGGIYAEACTLTIKDSDFSIFNWSGEGGGMYCRNSILSVARSTFSGNEALHAGLYGHGAFGSGGGICAPGTELTLTRCLFTNNRGTEYGGAVSGRGTFVWCIFLDNHASSGTTGGDGGAVAGGGTFIDCLFASNRGSFFGGAVSGGGTFTRCRFENNTVGHHYGGDGGAVSGGGTFIDCEFVGNGANGQGGAMALFGPTTITNCLFEYNYANTSGGGLWGYSGTLVNCTFYDNWGYDGGAFVFEDSVYVENTISAFNTSIDTTNWWNGVANLVCCDVYGNEGGDWVGPLAGQEGINGNFSANPMFCDSDNSDFTLASLSPCLPTNNDCGVLVGAYGQGCDYAVGVPDDRGVPPSQATLRAYPNPFNPTTTLEYYIPSSGEVSIRLFDVSGRLVTTLVDRHEGEGFYTVTWDGTDLRGQPVSSGVYFVRLESGELVQKRKIVLLK